MKLHSFEIKDYKSIKNSKKWFLSEDWITILAWQNESWKTWILMALNDFISGSLTENHKRYDWNDYFSPIIVCNFSYSKGDFDEFEKDFHFPISSIVWDSLITMERNFKTQSFDFEDEFKKNLIDNISSYIETWAEESETTLDETAIKSSCEEIMNEVSIYIKWILPKVIYFDDFCDLLPDVIYLSDLEQNRTDLKWYQAVKNLESIEKINFIDWKSYGDQEITGKKNKHSKSISVDFWEFWSQRIDELTNPNVHIEYNQWRDDWKWPYLNFFIETNDWIRLFPSQRSQWFRWFLSFYIQLKAEKERNRDIVILFDEPWLYLHSKAQNDIKKVFEELAKKWAQIIYSTHSPYLIDWWNLNRIRLIINTKEEWTTIEKITTDKIKDKKETLKPIVDAMWLSLAHEFSPIYKNNIIVEWISDYYYFTAFKKLFDIQKEYLFIPSMWVSNIHLLMELCIWWWLNWTIVMDNDKESQTARKKLEKNFKDIIENKIQFIDKPWIEEMFDKKDLMLVDNEIINKDTENLIETINTSIWKELFSRKFFEMVENWSITIDKISKNTHKDFQTVFTKIEEYLSI